LKPKMFVFTYDNDNDVSWTTYATREIRKISLTERETLLMTQILHITTNTENKCDALPH